ncbi:hypothetical protein LCGC14_2398670 [marine sediment metagenome]|uniref:Uncharacterized protein n=1 Tax=marine sediment metagenome TaxID=412755 RepID=A0A0F9BW35_9ZZZZ
MPSTGGATELYYYGTDPVVQVQITGELQLLTDWTRGQWDEKASKWSQSYPPLMPPEFLQLIRRSTPAAMRKGDDQRLDAAGMMAMPDGAMGRRMSDGDGTGRPPGG